MKPSSISNEAVEAAEQKHNQEWRDGSVDDTHQMVALAAT
jgi:hypothetical protein